MNPTMLAMAISAALAGAGGFGAAWTLQGRSIDKLRIEAKDDIINQQRASRQVADRLEQQVIAAQNAAAARLSRNTADRSRAADAGSGLRLASADTVRAAATGPDACTAALDAHAVVLAESIGFIQTLAAEADAWSVQAVALQEAWPK